MKRGVAAALTLILLAAIVRWRFPRPEPTGSLGTPVGCVQAMFDAAAQGAVERYLACFGKTERARLARDLGGDPERAREALRRSMADLKGWALLNPPPDRRGSPCQLTVEWVYATRVDRQQLELQLDGGAWRIVQVEQIRPQQPAIPYGTPVFEPAPPTGPLAPAGPLAPGGSVSPPLGEEPR